MTSRISNWTKRLSRITSGGNFIPEIDGLRFLAIGSVLVFHVAYSLGRAFAWKLGPWERGLVDYMGRGALGVELFFAISGFILALPFARYFLSAGKTIDIRRYYLRRLTRLEPPYVLVLIIFYLASLVLGDAEMKGRYLSTFFARLFYLHGLIYQEAPILNGVTWSLEIEVQFYLMVPLIVQVFRLPKAIRRVVLALAVVFLPFVPLHGIWVFSVFSQMAFFLSGFLFADVYLEMGAGKTRGDPRYDLAALIVLVGAIAYPWPDPIALWLLRRILPSLIFIFFYFLFRGCRLRRFFSWKPVYLVGGMCYSIYLIHYPFMAFFSRVLAKKMPGLGLMPAIAIGILTWVPVILVVSTIFFVMIEHPCMDHSWPQKFFGYVRRGMGWTRKKKTGRPEID